MRRPRGKDNMNATQSHSDHIIQAQTEEVELRDAVRVLSAVVGELAERVELLETRERIRDAVTP